MRRMDWMRFEAAAIIFLAVSMFLLFGQWAVEKALDGSPFGFLVCVHLALLAWLAWEMWRMD